MENKLKTATEKITSLLNGYSFSEMREILKEVEKSAMDKAIIN